MTTNKNSQSEKNLLLHIDLREEQEVRIAEVAAVITPLKEEIGTLHVSATVAYNEADKTRYLNLPVYVTETDQERRISLFFPNGVTISIWKDNAEAKINYLEYCVDKKTKAVNEKSGLSMSNTGFNQISIKLADMDPRSKLNSPAIKADVANQMQQITEWTKPIEITLIDIDGVGYVTEIINLERSTNNSNNFYYIDVKRPEALINTIKDEIIQIGLALENDIPDVHIGTSTPEERKIIYLYENNDNVITPNDNNTPPISFNWDIFGEEIQKGNVPIVYLCSPTSERYYPASYNFTKDPATGELKGIVEISYYKIIDNQLQLWVEQRNFDSFTGYTGMYDDKTSAATATPGPKIIKVTLGNVTN